MESREDNSEEGKGRTSPESQAQIQNPAVGIDRLTARLASRGLLDIDDDESTKHDTQPLQAIDDDDESKGHDTQTSQAIDEEEYPFQYLPTSTWSEEVDIHPGGDVIFVLEHKGTEMRLRVLSTIVALAPPVFKKMLGPDFREGRTLQANGQVEIPLADDDAVALKAMLYAMHFQHPEDAVPVKPSTMVDIAMLCDKYDCFQSIYPSFRLWLESLEENSGLRHFRKTLYGAVDALVAAVVVNNSELMDQFTQMVVGNAEHVIICPPRYSFLLPRHGVALFAKIEKQRLLLRSSLTESIEDTIELLSKNFDHAWPAIGPRCESSGDMLARLMSELRSGGLWPTLAMSKYSLLSIVDYMTDFYPQRPLCERGNGNDAVSACNSLEKWEEACTTIRTTGHEAKFTIESLHCSKNWGTSGQCVGCKKSCRRR